MASGCGECSYFVLCYRKVLRSFDLLNLRISLSFSLGSFTRVMLEESLVFYHFLRGDPYYMI